MRVFALSDIHVDYDVNARWLANLSMSEYLDDILILAGDVSDSLSLLQWTLYNLVSRFERVLFVPGNHDLWVIRESDDTKTSLDKFRKICQVVEQTGASMKTLSINGVSIVPLLSWYDYSFGQPSNELRNVWMDYRACRWPAQIEVPDIAAYFENRNEGMRGFCDDTVISFSHFLPRVDLIPRYAFTANAMLFPILGTTRLDKQIRALGSRLHVYGHSHLNRRVSIDGVTYINNALGYPTETAIVSGQLLCIHET